MPHDQPVVPLGTPVRAKCLGFREQNTDPAAPTGIPLEEVAGRLSGYYVAAFDYFKHIVAGYDVDPETIEVIDASELE
jgi:hypothetical protein